MLNLPPRNCDWLRDSLESLGVEARGVEPLSSPLSTQTSTCLSDDKFWGAKPCAGTLPAPERPQNRFTNQCGRSTDSPACCPRLPP